MSQIYGTTSNEPTKQELAHRALARVAAAEGFVLLKNENNALPLTNQKVALYGIGARKTVKGGLGSGSVEERYSVTIEEGLKNAGYEITTQSWLDDYDAEYTETYAAYHDMVEEKVAGLTNPMQIIPLAHRFVYRYPSGRAVTETDIAQSDTDSAVYVLTRQAGECNDRRLEKGDFLLTDIERKTIKTLAAGYARFILVLNVGGFIEMDFLDEIDGINAIVQFMQGGEEGGNALADVLTGKVNFSGKLADTVPMHYTDIPFGDEFSYLNGDVTNEYYKEGIYVGYRYFDAFQKAVRYPFGFGLSYTAFEITTQSVQLNKTKVELSVCVKNTGSCAGKEVVQVYLAAPQAGKPKEAKRLVAFAKTNQLAAGETQTLAIAFDLTEGASYDEGAAAWLLDGGDYAVLVGNSSRACTVSACVTLPQTVVTKQCKTCCAATDKLPAFAPALAPTVAISADVPHLIADAFETIVVDYTAPTVTETATESQVLDSLTLEEMAHLLQGGELQRAPKGALEIHGAGGKTATALLDKQICNVLFADGPAGVNIANVAKQLADGSFMPAVIPERYNWGMMAKMMAQQIKSTPGTPVYRYATAWPVEILLAQSWNTPLLTQIGDAVGKEMTEFGITVWLAPGMNIHRNPLGGRTFEYYSEDPVLTGKMAAALTCGVQQHKGVCTCIKHFCCNNSEDNRTKISANVSERALREVYLKGFEIAVHESQPKTLMSSYNLLNHTYTANRYDLLTDILRCEWGYEGLVMTDWGSTDDGLGDPALGAPSGNDLLMPGSDYNRARILAAIQNGTLSPETVRTSAARVLRIMLNANTPVLLSQKENYL